MSLVTGLAMAIGDGLGGADTGVVGLEWSSAAGGNVFEEQTPSSPDTAVGVFSSGGSEADSKLEYDAPHVQLIVRGDSDPETGKALWYLIYDYLHAKRYVTLPDGTYLVYILVVQSSPVPIGTDESGRYRYSMNLRCEVVNATSQRSQQ